MDTLFKDKWRESGINTLRNARLWAAGELLADKDRPNNQKIPPWGLDQLNNLLSLTGEMLHCLTTPATIHGESTKVEDSP